jgi:hypothetical protein
VQRKGLRQPKLDILQHSGEAAHGIVVAADSSLESLQILREGQLLNVVQASILCPVAAIK